MEEEEMNRSLISKAMNSLQENDDFYNKQIKMGTPKSKGGKKGKKLSLPEYQLKDHEKQIIGRSRKDHPET